MNSVKGHTGGAKTFDPLPDLGKEGLLVAVLDAFQVRQRHILEIRLRKGKKKEKKKTHQSHQVFTVSVPLSEHSLRKQLPGASAGVNLPQGFRLMMEDYCFPTRRPPTPGSK